MRRMCKWDGFITTVGQKCYTEISTMSSKQLPVLNIAKLKRLYLFSSLPYSLSHCGNFFFKFSFRKFHCTQFTHISMQIFIKTFFIYWPQYASAPFQCMCVCLCEHCGLCGAGKLVAIVTSYADWCYLHKHSIIFT